MKKPTEIFDEWLEEVRSSGHPEPTAMVLATVDKKNQPSARMVLLKKHHQGEFYFFTNYNSLKGTQLTQNPQASLLFHWYKPFHRQIRIQGGVEKTSAKESNEYFKTRSRQSQTGAWSSWQSQTLEKYSHLLERFQDYEKKFQNQSIPRPPHWGGFCLKACQMEFWEEQPHRLHHRAVYTRSHDSDPENWSGPRFLNP